MVCRLIQYRIAEAAVEDALLPWVEQHAMEVLDGPAPIVVAGHAHQILALKARVLREGLCCLGLRWVTASGLRRLVFESLGISYDPLGRENLELILRVAAREMKGTLGRSLSIDPSDALRAMDDLGRSGRRAESWGGILSREFSMLGSLLESTGQWMPDLERKALEVSVRSEVSLGPVMVFGWGGDHFQDLRLLMILKELCSDLTLTVPQPRFLGSEDVNGEWIRALEMQWGISSEVSQDPEDWKSRHEPFVNSLIMEASQEGAEVPELRVGYTVEDQVSVVVDWIERVIQHCPPGDPVGCLLPGEDSSLFYMTRELEKRGYLFHQEIGEVSPPGGFHTFHKLLVRCYVTQGDVEEVLRLLEWLLARKEACVAGLKYEWVRGKCLKRFNSSQIRCFSMLWPAEGQNEDGEERVLEQFARWLEPWPEEVGWEEARCRWAEVAKRFGFGTDYLEPVWSRLDGELRGKVIPSRYFFEYLESLLGAPGFWRDEKAVNPYARIIITTPEAAAGRTWAALVFMDCQEGVWPVLPPDNPFLKDGQRRELNRTIKWDAGESRLLSREDQNQLKRNLIFDLIENCRGGVLFSGNLRDGCSPEVRTFPNEWAAQVLLASSENAGSALDRWNDSIRAKRDDGAVWADAEAFFGVHRSREDPDEAPGWWDFRYQTGEYLLDVPLEASRLESLMASPAAGGLKRLFNVRPRSAEDFSRKEALLLGNWTHDTLARILKEAGGRGVGSVRDQYVAVVPPFPGLWMKVLAEKASWMVRSCLGELEHFGDEWRVHEVEWSPETFECQTAAGLLKLAGRMDLILVASDGRQRIIDFKTGRTGEIPTPDKLRSQAAGLQYIAYLLLTRDRDCTVRVINPFGAPDREMAVEQIEDAGEHLSVLAMMIHRNTYPRRGVLRDDYGSKVETLPLTTLPIDEDVLDRKWLKWIAEGADA